MFFGTAKAREKKPPHSTAYVPRSGPDNAVPPEVDPNACPNSEPQTWGKVGRGLLTLFAPPLIKIGLDWLSTKLGPKPPK